MKVVDSNNYLTVKHFNLNIFFFFFSDRILIYYVIRTKEGSCLETKRYCPLLLSKPDEVRNVSEAALAISNSITHSLSQDFLPEYLKPSHTYTL